MVPGLSNKGGLRLVSRRWEVKLERVHERGGSYRLAASSALVLGVSRALQCSFLLHGVPTCYYRRFDAPISPDAHCNFHVTLDSRLSRQRGIAELNQFGQHHSALCRIGALSSRLSASKFDEWDRTDCQDQRYETTLHV